MGSKNNQQSAAQNQSFGSSKNNDGLDIDETNLRTAEFDQFFKQFEPEETEEKVEEQNVVSENLEMTDYKILYRKDVEFAYIILIYTESENHISPVLFGFADRNEDNQENEMKVPTRVENIYEDQAYDQYIEWGWSDVTQEEDDYPMAIKTLLAQHMKQDTI